MVEGIRLLLELRPAPGRDDLQAVRLEDVLGQLPPPYAEPVRQERLRFLCLRDPPLLQGRIMGLDQIPGEKDLDVVQIPPQGPACRPVVQQGRHIGISARNGFSKLLVILFGHVGGIVNPIIAFLLLEQIPDDLPHRALSGQLQEIRVPQNNGPLEVLAGEALSLSLRPDEQPPEEQPPTLLPAQPQLLPGEPQHSGRRQRVPTELRHGRKSHGNISAGVCFRPAVSVINLVQQVVQHHGQAADQQIFNVPPGLVQPQVHHRVFGLFRPEGLHVHVQLAVGQTAPFHQRLRQPVDFLDRAPGFTPLFWLMPFRVIADEIPGGSAVGIPPAHQLLAELRAEDVGLRRNYLQLRAGVPVHPPLDGPARQNQIAVHSRHAGAHGLGLVRHEITAPDFRRLPHPHRRAADRADGFVAGPDQRRLPGLFVLLEEAIAPVPFVRLGPGHNSGCPAARAADFYHFPLPGRGPFVQHLFQPAIRYPHGLINKAPKLQSIPDRGPGRQALRRRPGYQLCHSFHGVTSKSPPAP